MPTGKRTASLASAITKVNSVAFSPDGITLADAGTIDRAEVTYGAIELWNLSNGRKIASIVTGMNANVTSIAISPDGTTLATCSQISVFDFHYGVIALWSVQTGALITTFDTGRLISDTVAFSPDGKKLACGGTRYVSGVSEGGLDLWDISTRRLLSSLPMNPIGGSVNAVDFSSDGRVLLAGTSSGLQTFSAADYSLMNTFTGGGITSIAVSSGSLPIILLGQAGLQAISNP